MKNILITTLSGFCLLLLCTCKKYDEGGLTRLTRKHLFGGKGIGSTKSWSLKLYEVNGIDSTALIPGANTIPDYYGNFITLTMRNPQYNDFVGTCFFYEYKGAVGAEITFSKLGRFAKQDSMQCYDVGGTQYCCRNILIPEGLGGNSGWHILKLTSSELQITNEMKNSYKIILTAR